MALHNITTRLLQYNFWANERIISFLKSIDPNLLYKKTGSSFGTIDRTLQHILSAQKYWHQVIAHEKIPPFDEPARENAAHQVMEDLILSSQQLITAFSDFNEQQLVQPIQASDSRQSRYEYILHVVNHSSYHRGQVVTLCRALGITEEIPVTDYDAYLWWIENR